jgi:hypothetical protein
MPVAKPRSTQSTKARQPADPSMNEIIKIRSAQAWRPSAGDMVDGTVVKLLARESDFGIYPIVIMDTGEPQYIAIHAFHTILRDALRELKTKPSDELVVVYQGKTQSNKPYGEDAETKKKLYRSYHNYLVIGNGVDSTVEFTWDSDTDDEPDF